MYVYMYKKNVCMYVSMKKCMYVSKNVCMYVYMKKYMYVC